MPHVDLQNRQGINVVMQINQHRLDQQRHKTDGKKRGEQFRFEHVAIRVPRPAPGTSDAYLRLIPRSEMDIAVAGVAVSVTVDADGVCTAARVAIGAVAPTALLVAEAAKALIGSRLDDAALKRAAEASSAAARPIDDKRGTTAYRRTIAGVLTRRAAAIAKQRVVS